MRADFAPVAIYRERNYRIGKPLAIVVEIQHRVGERVTQRMVQRLVGIRSIESRLDKAAGKILRGGDIARRMKLLFGRLIPYVRRHRPWTELKRFVRVHAVGRDDVFAIEPFLTLGDAAGYVVDDSRATIYSLTMRKRTGSKELDGLVERIWGLRKSLPFTPRWFSKEYGRGQLLKMLRELEKLRILRGYPTLVEASKAPVAQFEHTMALVGSSVSIFT